VPHGALVQLLALLGEQFEQACQAQAREVLHHQHEATGVLEQVVDVDDARVVETQHHLSFSRHGLGGASVGVVQGNQLEPAVALEAEGAALAGEVLDGPALVRKPLHELIGPDPAEGATRGRRLRGLRCGEPRLHRPWSSHILEKMQP
jgi:hypothetical protein